MAHKRLKECCEDSLSEIIYIRQCVLDEYRNAERSFILLETTTGVGFLNEGEMGTAEKLRCENLIIPSSQDQEKIMTAIYSIKAGEIDKAKKNSGCSLPSQKRTW